MRRLHMSPRDNWRDLAQAVGFIFHTPDGEPYWDESVCYAFTLPQIEQDLEEPTAELWSLFKEFADRAARDETALRRMRIRENAWDLIADSWRRREPTLYGRFDLAYSGIGPAKLLELNGDTPTALFEAAVFQWQWFEDLKSAGRLPGDADQFNSLHEKLIDRWKHVANSKLVHFACMTESAEDFGTIAYLADCAEQAGFRTQKLDVKDIGEKNGSFVDLSIQPMNCIFKLYPWEFLFQDQFGQSGAMRHSRFVEPAWKMLLSNKAVLALLWEMAPRHPNLLPAYFEGDDQSASLGDRYARKPIWSREGANITLFEEYKIAESRGGTYGAEGYILQAMADLTDFEGNFPVIGSWIVGDEPAGIGIREDASRITGDSARFIPHFIE